MDFLKKAQQSFTSSNPPGAAAEATTGTGADADADTSKPDPLPYPDDATAEDLGMNLEDGPDFESLYNPNAPVSNPLQVSPNIQAEIDRYIDTKIISKQDEVTYSVSGGFRALLEIYRKATKLYFMADYITNYNSATFIQDKIKDAPGLVKSLIQQNSVFLLLFLDPSFLSLLVVFFILQTILQLTFLPNQQNFEYSDIPRSFWYIPMYITRFIGNMFFFLFYILILFWAGMRRLVNEKASVPMTLMYITAILLCVQLIFQTFIVAVSGELPKTAIRDSITAILSYSIPLIMFSFIPNVIRWIPSGSVRKHKTIPILPCDPKASKHDIHYAMDMSIIQCYTSGRFYQNVSLYTLFYIFTTALLYPLDPSLSTFIRGDLQKLKHRNDIKKPAAMLQNTLEKLFYAALYHASVILTVSVSAISITGMPYPYNSAGSAYNHGLLFAFLLPLGKLLIEFKYRSDEMDFYGVFYDTFMTFFRIMIPLIFVTKIEQIKQLLGFIMFFDPTHPIPTWMVYVFILVVLLIFTMIIRQIAPSSDPSPKTSPSESQIEQEEKTEKAIQSLITRAKSILFSLQKAEDKLQS